MTDVLAFGAHPDDVELRVGATLHAFARRGYAVGVVHLTRGEAATRGDPQQRRREAEKAAEALGARLVAILDLGDGRLADVPHNRDAVIGLLRCERPRLVLAPAPFDEHPDHAGAGALLRSSWYLAGVRRLGRGGSPHRAPSLWFYPGHQMCEPTHVFVVDEEDVEAKRAALLAYPSQFDAGTTSDPRTRLTEPGFVEAVFGRMRHFGALVEAAYAEPFLAQRPLAFRCPEQVLARPEEPGP